ncbi:MAG: MFS transporter [Demequinaceae bacterium]|nr:MFS transporter [Demequinaceae bacterium]
MNSSASATSGSPGSFWSRAGYASGDLGISIAYFAFGFFFLYYLTDLVGLPPAVAGVVLFIGKLWDGVNDPLIGALSDRTRSRHGRKRVYLLYGAVPFGVSFAVLWWIPATASEGAKVALATALVLVFATTYSFVGVPYQALVPVISGDYDERTRLVGFKAVFSAFGAILGGIIALVLSDGEDMTSTLRLMAFVFAVLITVLVLVAAFATRRTAHDDTHPIAPVPLADYVRLAVEPNVAILLGYKALGAVATGVMTAALPFFAKYVVGDGTLSTYSLAIYTIVGGGLVAVWVRLARRYDKRRLVLVSNTAAGMILIAIALLTSSDASVVFLVGSALLGAAMSAYLVLPPSLVPDLVDWYEHTSGTRHESVFFGLWMTVHQLGLGMAALVLGLVLQWSGYVQDADVQSSEAVTGVRLAFGLIPAVFLVLAALVLQRYRITRERLAEAQAALAASGVFQP